MNLFRLERDQNKRRIVSRNDALKFALGQRIASITHLFSLVASAADQGVAEDRWTSIFGVSAGISLPNYVGVGSGGVGPAGAVSFSRRYNGWGFRLKANYYYLSRGSLLDSANVVQFSGLGIVDGRVFGPLYISPGVGIGFAAIVAPFPSTALPPILPGIKLDSKFKYFNESTNSLFPLFVDFDVAYYFGIGGNSLATVGISLGWDF